MRVQGCCHRSAVDNCLFMVQIQLKKARTDYVSFVSRPFSPLPAAHGLQLHKILLKPIFLLPKFSALRWLRAENLGLKEKLGLIESCAVEGSVRRAMVNIVKETLQWSRHVLFKMFLDCC